MCCHNTPRAVTPLKPNTPRASFFNSVDAFLSVKVISQAKVALCSANILGEQWMVIDQLKYLQGSHATVSILHILHLKVASVLQYLNYLILSCSAVACGRILYFKVQEEQ